MDTRETLIGAALKVLEEDGEATFSSRAVLAIAGLSAPTLYHHFGSVDGMLDAAIAEAFRQYLGRKPLAEPPGDSIAVLLECWDDYVQFAAERPRLYAAMQSRLLSGVHIQAAQEVFRRLHAQLTRIEAGGQLGTTVESAADQLWAAANSGVLLHVLARLRGAPPPQPDVLKNLQGLALKAILRPTPP